MPRCGNAPTCYIGYGTVVPVDDTFLIVGGLHYAEGLDKIYRYEKESDSWTEQEATLPVETGIAAPVAMMVDIDIFPSC